jgi:ribosomal protein S18 acetylase RimI-like enzyme
MLDLPPEWARAGYAFRRARARDRNFQRHLFGLARPDAALIAQWPAAQRDAFLDSQFALQDTHYRRFFGGADYFIITREGAPVGRIILHKSKRDWRLIDIALMPEQRGRGLGTALLRGVQAACAAAGAESLSLHVEFANRARDLYARLGFVETGDIGSHIEMAWTAADQLKTAS